MIKNEIQPKTTWNAETEQILLHFTKRWRWQLKLELAWYFKVGEWEIVTFATRFTSIRLVKQKGFCRAIALAYFVEKIA